MRLAWIKMGGLWPLNTGGRQRTYQMLSALAHRHHITLVTTHGPDDDAQQLAARLTHCDRVISLPYRVPKFGGAAFVRAVARSWMSSYPVDLWKWRVPAVSRALRDLLAAEPFDAVITDFLFAEPNVPRTPDVPMLFFAHNVEHQIWRRLASVEPLRWRRAVLEIEWRKMRRCESEAVRRADVTVAVSEADRDQFLDAVPDSTVHVVPTGVDTDFFAPAGRPEVPRRLVFSGSMDWYPNEDALLDFAANVWPRLRARHADVTMTVVGRNPTARLREAAAAAGIDVTGTVDDVRPFIDEAQVYVVPLRVGGGTRLKIFEALAMQKPVVSTSIGAEGLGLVPDRHFVAADGHEAFANAILQLLGDAPQRAALGAEGRRLVEECYSWAQVARDFERSVEHAARRNQLGVECADRRLAVS